VTERVIEFSSPKFFFFFGEKLQAG